MKSLNLRGKQSKNGKYHSYKGEVGKIADNILKRDFTAKKPFEKLTTDVTEFKVCDDKVYLSPVLDLFNREIVSYSISLSPNLQQVRDMLTGLFAKLPQGATPIFHSDQGWQYQHAEYQRLLAEHNITQSMSRKGNCMDNGAMENFFGRLKVEMFYGEQFENVDDFILALHNYIRPGGKFCVSVFRQNQEYHVINVHDGAYSPWLHPSRKVGAVCAPRAA